jgi:hypothetical protein
VDIFYQMISSNEMKGDMKYFTIQILWDLLHDRLDKLCLIPASERKM